jgi:MFS transporter, DHA1 family, multidrug resistance protein
LSQPSIAEPSFGEFVAMMAASMALNALAIDMMLPALTDIGRAFRVADATRLQWIITAFMMGAGSGQLFFGPLSDRFGRKPVMLSGLGLYVGCSLLAMLATSLGTLIAARVAQGLFVSASSVLPRSIVRDRYHGATMARVMSTIFIVFVLVPMLAPALGQALLVVTSWRGLFGVLAGGGVLVASWIAWRLPETLAPEHRRPLSSAHLLQAGRTVLGEPSSILYTLAVTSMFGALLAYVSCMPQIFAVAFGRPKLMTTVFASCAAAMGLASFCNSRIVERVGMYAISRLALALYLVVTLAHMLLARFGSESVLSFALFQAATMACFSLSVANFGAIAMLRMGSIAGSAASLQGLISTVGGAAIAALIGQQWSGSVLFLPTGSFLCGVAAAACILWANRRERLSSRPLAP